MARTTKSNAGEGAAAEPERNKSKEDFEDAAGKIPGDESETLPGEDGGADEKPGSAGVDPIEEIRAELEVEREKYLRLAAEYDNYRKRSIKEREMIYADARSDAITRLLPVYDNLERALKTDCADDAFYKGVEMTMTQLTEIMECLGVKPIPAVGQSFDPNCHNAVMTIEDPELGEKVISEEYQKGFKLGDKVIRFSTVVVAN